MQRQVLIIALHLEFAYRRPSPHHGYAGGTYCCPEHGPRPPAQRQRQSSGARHTEQICNENISTFIGPEVAWTHDANEVDHLRQALQRTRTDHADLCSHEMQDQIYLQDGHCMPQRIERQVRIECGRVLAIKGEQVAFS